VALLHAAIGTLIPLFVSALLTRFFGEHRSWREGLAVWRFALLAGFSFTVPYALLGVYAGPEFPSLAGGLIALALTVCAARHGIAVPREAWHFPEQDRWPDAWLGAALPESKADSHTRIPLIAAWLPYLLAAALLLLVRLPQLPVRDWLEARSLNFPVLPGSDIAVTLDLPGSPGTVFLLIALLCVPLYRMNHEQVLHAAHDAGRALLSAALVLAIAVPMVRIFIQSGVNAAGLASMPIELASGVAALAGTAWPALAAVIGAIGAFIAGSNTVSNLTFALFQFGVGIKTGLSPPLIVALQAVGGAAGNMICIHNIVAASATCGLSGREGALIRMTLIPTLYYLAAAGMIGCTILLVLGH
jgi:lactate permease